MKIIIVINVIIIYFSYNYILGWFASKINFIIVIVKFKNYYQYCYYCYYYDDDDDGEIVVSGVLMI